jgi:hypothetical protein
VERTEGGRRFRLSGGGFVVGGGCGGVCSTERKENGSEGS